MVQSPYIQRVKVVDGNATEAGTVTNPFVVTGNVTTSSGNNSVDNVDIFPSNWIGAYDVSNNLTQSTEVIGGETKTVTYAYDASNNMTNFSTVIT